MKYWLLPLLIWINIAQDCQCDLNADLCDEFCCCDSKCATITILEEPIINTWDKSKKCVNLLYAGSYNIPNCNIEYQKSVQDLYQGLRIAYNIFKNLGCVTTVNSQIDLFEGMKDVSPDTITLKNNYYLKDIVGKPQNYLKETFLLPYPRSSMDNVCGKIKVLDLKTYPPRWCIQKLRPIDGNVNIYDYQNAYYANLTVGVTIDTDNTIQLIYDSDPFQRLKVKAIGAPTNFPSNSTVTLTNLVVGGIYRITEQDNATGSSTRITTKVVFTPFVIDQINPINGEYIIPLFSGIIYTSNNASVYGITGKQGYELGSAIRFKKSTLEEFILPMYIGLESENVLFQYSSHQGNCSNYSATAISMAKPLSINFLQDQKITCNKSDVGFADSSFSQAILQNLIKVAMFGDSDPNNPKEWSDVIKQQECTSAHNQMTIQFNYEQFGERGKDRYKIVLCTLRCSSDNLDTDSFAVLIKFFEIVNSYINYKAPAPQLVGGLPNDVLAPFIIY